MSGHPENRIAMTSFRYTPYADSKVPFTIGLEPLDPTRWIEPDQNLPHYLAEKTNLLSTRRDDVFQARTDTVAAQQEVLDLLVDYLPKHHPDYYRSDGMRMEVLPVKQEVSLQDPGKPPLEIAAGLIQDDLVIMRPGHEGYELVAASVCFPSSWMLSEKFGRTLEAIHEPVPGYEGKMARRMNLIFDRLPRDQIVWRSNWSVYDSNSLPIFKSHAEFSHLNNDIDFDGVFVRVERQTLRRLQKSGDLLFTIMIYIDPLHQLRAHPDSQTLAKGLKAQLLALNADELSYKSLNRRQTHLADYLDEIITAPRAPSGHR